jgi:hypothetical protein
LPDLDAPPRSISDRASAEAEADRLWGKGFIARVERVRQPKAADVAAGLLGYRVRVGHYAGKADADAASRARPRPARPAARSTRAGPDPQLRR